MVTGGLGFVGSHLVAMLLERNYAVINLDKVTYSANPRNLEGVTTGKRYHFYKGDVADERVLNALFTRHEIDHVINVAAETHVDRSISDPAVFLRTNVLGVNALLDCARKRDVQRFVQVSTDEVYGSLGPDDPSFIESSPIRPNSPYSASKAAADCLVNAYFKTYGLDVTITRSSNNYGPKQHAEKLVPVAIKHALADQPVPLYGSGANVRDWMHVEDHCRGLVAALERGRPGRLYNLGAGQECSNLDLVRQVLALLGKPSSLVEFVPDRPGHDFRYSLDHSRATKELGWEPLVSLQDGLKETVEWYVQNPEWLSP